MQASAVASAWEPRTAPLSNVPLVKSHNQVGMAGGEKKNVGRCVEQLCGYLLVDKQRLHFAFADSPRSVISHGRHQVKQVPRRVPARLSPLLVHFAIYDRVLPYTYVPCT